MSNVSGPGMHTFCVMFGRGGEGWHFAAISPRQEVARISRQLSDDDVAAITVDRDTWPAWSTWQAVLWARGRRWSLASVLGCDANTGNAAIT